MSWLDRFSAQPIDDEPPVLDHHAPMQEGPMNPGLTGQYDYELREKAAMRMPPPPPEYMGVDGEYDPSGLAKRVALALEDDPIASQIDHLRLIQTGSTICFEGQIDNQQHLDHVVQVAAQVDGTEAVDASRVNIAA